MKYLFLSLVFLFSTSYRSDLFCQELPDKIDAYLSSFQLEKIYVHHDKPSYILGDTIWAKLYLLDGYTHAPLLRNEIVYVDWIDPYGDVILNYNLLAVDGLLALDIPSSIDDKSGQYTIRAYTLYQKNFDEAFMFQKRILLSGLEEPIIEEPNEKAIVMQFFPEGGYLVDGLESKVAFKAINANGDALEISGEIVNDNGEPKINFESLKDGLGFFSLTPEKGVSYKASYTLNGQTYQYDLPEVLKKGYTINASSRNTENIKLNISSTEDLKSCVLVGHARGSVFLTQTFASMKSLSLALPKKDMPEGLLHFTMFDHKQRPVIERLLYNNVEEYKNKITIQVGDVYEKRGLVELSLDPAELLKSDTAYLSLSVFNDDYTERNQRQGLNIHNYLFLQSELKGKILNINQYFDNSTKSRSLLDLLLMTHGWSRFTWQEILDEPYRQLDYPIEKKFSLSGQTLKLGSNKPVKTNIILSLLQDDKFSLTNIETADDGVFHIEELNISDTTELLLQANIYSKKKLGKLKEGEIKRVGDNRVDIKLIDLHEMSYDSLLSIPLDPAYMELVGREASEKKVDELVLSTYGLEGVDSSLWSLELEEVTMKASRLSVKRQKLKNLRRRYIDKGIFYFSSTEKFFADDMFKLQSEFRDLYDMVNHVLPVSYVRGAIGNREVYYNTSRGFKLAKIGLDGALVNSAFLENLDPLQIEAVEIIYGAKADAIFGTAERVIHFITKDGVTLVDVAFEKMKRGNLSVEHPGFYTAKAFYNRMYETDFNSNVIDRRTTLYWNPSIILSKENRVFKFYSSDLVGKHLIRIEGVTKNGKVIQLVKSFNVNRENK